jgi:hypothetical protein
VWNLREGIQGQEELCFCVGRKSGWGGGGCARAASKFQSPFPEFPMLRIKVKVNWRVGLLSQKEFTASCPSQN